MNKTKNVEELEHLKEIAASAFKFFELSAMDLFKEPKLSIASFSTALELLLKVRLVKEHWGLVFANPQEINYSAFLKGGFVSIGFKDAIKRINGIHTTHKEIDDDVREAFLKVAGFRNSILHFHTPTGLIKREAISALHDAWKHIYAMLECNRDAVWYKILGHNIESRKLEALNTEFAKIGRYFEFVHLAKRDAIMRAKTDGHKILKCRVCNYDAVPSGVSMDEFHTTECFVCNFTFDIFLYECNCGGTVAFIESGENISCPSCGQNVGAKDIVFKLDDYENSSKAVCTSCADIDEGEYVVENKAKYKCANCFCDYDKIERCENCSIVFACQKHEEIFGDCPNPQCRSNNLEDW